VTDGVESAMRQAKEAAGAANVLVHGADLAQSCLRAGVLDELEIHLVPVLLGDGRRLFEHLGSDHIALERMRVVEAPGVTHLRYRVWA
jgi:dihydrofolate reductase